MRVVEPLVEPELKEIFEQEGYKALAQIKAEFVYDPELGSVAEFETERDLIAYVFLRNLLAIYTYASGMNRRALIRKLERQILKHARKIGEEAFIRQVIKEGKRFFNKYLRDEITKEGGER